MAGPLAPSPLGVSAAVPSAESPHSAVRRPVRPLQLQLHGLARAAADHRTDRLRAVQRGVELRGPADDRVRVDVHRLLRRDGYHQRVALADQPQTAVTAEDAVEDAAAGDARALHGLYLVRQRGVEAQDVAPVHGEQVTRLDADDETVLRLVREPGLALPAHRHQRQSLTGDRPLEHAAHALALALELQIPPVGDHRPLAREHVAVDGVLDRLGVLDGHARRDGGLHHVVTGKEITLHAGILARRVWFRQDRRHPGTDGGGRRLPGTREGPVRWHRTGPGGVVRRRWRCRPGCAGGRRPR